MGLSHRASSRLALGICEILPICHCSVGGKVLRISFQYLMLQHLIHEIVFKLSAIVRQDVPRTHMYW